MIFEKVENHKTKTAVIVKLYIISTKNMYNNYTRILP